MAATEENETKNTKVISDNNDDLIKITENSRIKDVRVIDQERLNEYSLPKKRYYLASCNDNLDTLNKEQENGLTKVLIALKKEHDNIRMESLKSSNETSILEKKIKMMQLMDNKIEQKKIDSKLTNENIKKAIEISKGRLKEEEYRKKTLSAILSKLKRDKNLNEISLRQSYEKQIVLNQKLHRQKLIENEIKSKNNQINSLINSQKERNLKDLKEYNLKVQYYNTIIDQKLEFLRAADERKERQLKIAQDAKKTTGDKDEKEKREQLELLYLMNNYLRKKMEKELENNKDMEETFRKIKLICGTNNLKTIIEKVIFRDKQFNYIIRQINEKEERKKYLTKEIQKLETNFTELSNEVIVDIDTVNKRDIKVIKARDVDDSLNNELLINEEIELTNKVNFNKELNNLVSLRYDQVINSLKKLCNRESINYLKSANQNASRLNNNQSGMSTIDHANTSTIKPDNITNENNVNSLNNISIINEETNKNININVNEARKSENTSFDRNASNDFSLLDELEEQRIINDYKEYLIQAEKTIDALFLIKTKKDFLQMIRDKVSEFDDANRTIEIIEKHSTTKENKSLSKSLIFTKHSQYNELEYCDDDKDLGKEAQLQEKIFKAYMNAERRKMEKFINNERETKPLKNLVKK